MKKFTILGFFLLAFAGSAHAQGPQCRTSPVGTSSPWCASEAFVTAAIAAFISGTPSANQFALWADATHIKGVSPASKSDQQTGTSTTAAVTPAHQQDHDSAAKASVYFTVSGGSVTVQESYNVTSVTRVSAGIFNITFTTAFANTFYRGAGIAESNTLNMSITATFTTTKTTSVYQIGTINDLTGGVADPAAVGIAFFGRQ